MKREKCEVGSVAWEKFEKEKKELKEGNCKEEKKKCQEETDKKAKEGKFDEKKEKGRTVNVIRERIK